MSVKVYPIIISAILFGVISCRHQKEHDYYLKNKWKIGEGYAQPLKGNPKKVTEYEGLDTGNINLTVPGSMRLDRIVEFNEAGDMVKYSVSGGNPDLASFRTVYKDDGYQTFIFQKSVTNGKELLSQDFKRVAANKYEDRHYTLTNTRGIRFTDVEFKNDGNEIVKTLRFSAANRLLGAKFEAYEQYDGQKILNETTISRDEVRQTHYEYSPEGFLKRVLADNNGSKTETIFENNQQGDAIRIIELDKRKDTTDIKRREFRYDKKGNWVRMLEETTFTTYKMSTDRLAPKVYIREISY
ncbi:hypothetical protein [Ferruginibacter sp. HRS2-29]|uniref:hypothetical protein n=1 Tax=Ferruginibacter sp. HRS2-29 TaxID=2487334 RepID=UPI0020CCA1C1|nr:hypothetical protein [Ferruginibacter sp. HRS2-29]MCP9750325.1 hypothetical protein [Ferruginibacter sp. HRS2-29]